MPALKNPRHERFVQELVKGRPVATAYRLAGYKAHDGHGIRLRHKPAIARRYDELIAAAARHTEVTAARLMNEMATIAFANIADYVAFDAEGLPQPDLSRLSRVQMSAVVEIAVDERKQGGQRVRFKLADKLGALVDLARMLGLFREPVAAEPAAEPMSDAEAARRIAFILQKADSEAKQQEQRKAAEDEQKLQ